MNSWAARLAFSVLFITLGVLVGPRELPNVAMPLVGIGLVILAYQCLRWISDRFTQRGSSTSRVRFRRRPKPSFQPETHVPPKTSVQPAPPIQPKHPTSAQAPIPPWIALQRQRSTPATEPIPPKPRPNVIRPSLSATSRPLVQPTFAGRGARVVMGPYKLVDPLIYIVDCEVYPDFDASLLCLRRRIDAPRPEPPKALGYWPRLSEIKPYQVGNYLDWHARGRASPEMDIGYVFLFFYGLERRSLIDGQDVAVIGQEVLRLLRIYKGSGSFCGYATGLLAHLIMSGRLMPTDGLIDELLTFQDRYVSDEMSKLLIGYLAREKKSLRSNWAMKLAEQSEGASRSVYATRHRAEAEQLFQEKYQRRFGEGIVPTRRDRETEIEYRAASPSLLRGASAAGETLTAHWVSAPGWPRTFAPVVELWNESLVELRQLARKVSPATNLGDQVEFDSLQIVDDGADQERQQAWDKLLSEFTPESGHILIPVNRLASHWGQTGPTLRLRQSRTLAEMVQSLGMALEPDPRFTGRRYDLESHVAVLKLPDEPIQVSSPAFALAGTVVRLALVVATADELLDEDEARAIVHFVEETLPLSRNEQLRLRALVEVLGRDGVSLVGLKKQLSAQFDQTQREALGRYLVAVAATSNGIDEAEIAALERGFQTLGLERGFLDQLLFSAREHPEGPVLVEVGSPPLSGERIPAAPTTGLDLSRIRQLRQESDEVAKMLLSAMGAEPQEDGEGEEEKTEGTVAESAETAPPTDTSPVFPGLRPELEALLQVILKVEGLPLADFEKLARTHGTSMAAAINEINEWSDEHLGDFLIEESDPIVIHRRLLSEKGMTP